MSMRQLAFQLVGKAVSAYAQLPWTRGRGFLIRCARKLAPDESTYQIRRGRLLWNVDPIHGGMIARDLFFLGRYEAESTAWANASIGKDWVCIDVGANIGYYSLLLARLVGPNGRVISFEPTSRFRGELEKNVRANVFKNVTVEALAL